MVTDCPVSVRAATQPRSRSGIFLPSRPDSALRTASSLLERAVADDAVRRHPGVALEVEDGALDLLVVHAALRPGVEAEQVELDLELQHVVAAERRLAQVEQAVAQGVAGLHQLAPGVGAHAPVGEQPALLLEREHGDLGAGAEEAVDALSAQLEALPAQAGLDVEDFFAAVAAGEVAHRRLLVGR